MKRLPRAVFRFNAPSPETYCSCCTSAAATRLCLGYVLPAPTVGCRWHPGGAPVYLPCGSGNLLRLQYLWVKSCILWLANECVARRGAGTWDGRHLILKPSGGGVLLAIGPGGRRPSRRSSVNPRKVWSYEPCLRRGQLFTALIVAGGKVIHPLRFGSMGLAAIQI